MNTATILIENVIQGMQTFAWLTLVVCSFCDIKWDPAVLRDNVAPASFLVLASCYWLGIVVDTMYYHLFIQRREARWANAPLGDGGPTLSTMVCKCILANGDLARLLLERQAHLRLLRVSLVNSVFITVALLLFLHVGLARHSVLLTLLVVATGAAAFVSIAFTWRRLYHYYVAIVRTSYQLIVEMPAK